MAGSDMKGLRSLLVVAALAGIGPAGLACAEPLMSGKPLAMLENSPQPNGLGEAGAGSVGANESEPAKPLPEGNPLWAIPLRTLSVTRERPLFSPSRRPPAPAVLGVEPPPPPLPTIKPAAPERPPLILVGTIIGENEKLAIFFNQVTNSVTRVREGEAESGWLLRSVAERAIILQKDNQTVTLDLPKRSEERPASGLPAPPPSSDNL
jgi:general secretion pathway protein N